MPSRTGSQGSTAAADDYLVKPFSFAELLARLRALVRRAPGRAAAGARGRRPSARPGRAPSVARRRRDRPLGQGVRAAGGVHAPAGRGALALAAARQRLGHRLSRAARTSSTSTSATCARRSTGRSAAHSLETVRGVGYRLREDGVMSRLPIRLRLTLAFALAMARRAGRDGLLRLRPRRQRAARVDRPEPRAPAADDSRLDRGSRVAALDRRLRELARSVAQVIRLTAAS